MSIILENLTKRFDGRPVVNNVTLEIQQGEFFVLLGSSGSGKTTILNLVAGLTEMDQGRILLNGRDVSNLPVQNRRVGYVFQNYALFQHMTVNDNIDFGPSIYKVPKAERKKRREQLLEMVGLTGLGSRYPRQLSGGQQQRVALARALAHNPEVLLLDEPLGALDARIRVELRRTLRAIQRELGITTILVTHDQEEAFDLADRIGVMNYGRLIEEGTPLELYRRPKSEFVASFLGTPNLLVANAARDGVQIGPAHLPLRAGENGGDPVGRIQVLFRPEDVVLSASSAELDCPCLGMAEVEETAFSGAVERLRLRLPPIPDVRPIAPAVPFGTKSILVEATRSHDIASRLPLLPGERAWVGVRQIHALANPGMHFLIVTDGSLRSQAALEIGGEIARLAHARVTLLGCGQPADKLEPAVLDARKSLGSGLPSIDVLTRNDPAEQAVRKVIENQQFDLIILGFDPPEHTHLVDQLLQMGEHHLLLAPLPKNSISKALICLSNDEPGKNSIFFPGRLAYHLGLDATLMTVLPAETTRDPFARTRAEHLLENGVSSLALFGICAGTKMRSGVVYEEILKETGEGGYDLLVLGAPARARGRENTLHETTGRLLQEVRDCPVLLVQAGEVRL